MIKKLFKKFITKTQRKECVSVYAIFSEKPILKKDGTIQNNNIEPVTFAADEEQAEAALNRLLYIKHLVHFRSWLFFSKNIETMQPSYDSDLWREYKNNILQNSDEYYNEFYVLKLTYSATEIASLLRVFSDCEPLYLPHEQISELAAYFSAHVDESGKISLPVGISRAIKYDEKMKREVEEKYAKIAAEAVKLEHQKQK